MKKGKVVLIGGTKRAGKTTLSIILHKKYGFNYINFDHLEDAIDTGINKIDGYNNGDYFFDFLEEVIDYSLEDAENYGINTVLDTYMYYPELLSKLRVKNNIEVIYLADLNVTEDELRENLKKYSASFDWPPYCSNEDYERNIKCILMDNDRLKEQCKDNNFN